MYVLRNTLSQAGLLYDSPRYGMVPEKIAVDQSNESYYAGKGEYINLVVLTLEHHQAPFVILSFGCFIGLIFFYGEYFSRSTSIKGNEKGIVQNGLMNEWVGRMILRIVHLNHCVRL